MTRIPITDEMVKRYKDAWQSVWTTGATHEDAGIRSGLEAALNPSPEPEMAREAQEGINRERAYLAEVEASTVAALARERVAYDILLARMREAYEAKIDKLQMAPAIPKEIDCMPAFRKDTAAPDVKSSAQDDSPTKALDTGFEKAFQEYREDHGVGSCRHLWSLMCTPFVCDGNVIRDYRCDWCGELKVTHNPTLVEPVLP